MIEYWIPSWWDRDVTWNKILWEDGGDPSPPQAHGGINHVCITAQDVGPPDAPFTGGGPPPAAAAAATINEESVDRLNRLKKLQNQHRVYR